MGAETTEYTREELDKMSRTNLRRAAVSCGMAHRDATKMESSDIKDYIMSKQGDGEEKKSTGRAGKGAGKAATAKVKGRKAKAAPEPVEEVEEVEEAEEEAEAAAPVSGGVAKLIHKVGLGMDDGFKELMAMLETMQAEQEEIKAAIQENAHSLYLLSGLMTDVLKNDWEPKEVDERIGEIEEAWQEQLDGDDSGNEE